MTSQPSSFALGVVIPRLAGRYVDIVHMVSSMSSSPAVTIGPRPRVDDRHLVRVASHLTERDRVVTRSSTTIACAPACSCATAPSPRCGAPKRDSTFSMSCVWFDRFHPHQWPGLAS